MRKRYDTDFYHSARWVERCIVVSFVRRRLRRRRPPHAAFWLPFCYYTNMVQHIKFIQTFNPSGNFLFPRSRSKVKGKDSKNSCQRDNLKNNYWIYDYIFSFPPIIKMAATWRLNFFVRPIFCQNSYETWYL